MQQLDEPLFQCHRKNPSKCSCRIHNNGLMNFSDDDDDDQVVFRSNRGRGKAKPRVLSESENEEEEENEEGKKGRTSILEKMILKIPLAQG